MQGILTTKDGHRYLFRSDTHALPPVWAWRTDGEINDKITVNKWFKLPKGAAVVLFDVDNPPRTVSYNPILE